MPLVKLRVDDEVMEEYICDVEGCPEKASIIWAVVPDLRLKILVCGRCAQALQEGSQKWSPKPDDQKKPRKKK